MKIKKKFEVMEIVSVKNENLLTKKKETIVDSYVDVALLTKIISGLWQLYNYKDEQGKFIKIKTPDDLTEKYFRLNDEEKNNYDNPITKEYSAYQNVSYISKVALHSTLRHSNDLTRNKNQEVAKFGINTSGGYKKDYSLQSMVELYITGEEEKRKILKKFVNRVNAALNFIYPYENQKVNKIKMLREVKDLLYLVKQTKKLWEPKKE